MSKKELATVNGDIFFAACLTYLGYELAYVTKLDQSLCSYTIQCAALDFEDLRISYYVKGDLALADAKAFVNAFNVLTQKQQIARRNGQWTSSAWANGAIG